MEEFLVIAARCYGGEAGDVALLNASLTDFLRRVNAKVVRAKHGGGYRGLRGSLRSSQIVALACELWEQNNPGVKPYGE